jgi:FkbM family methyltransferase
MINFFYSIIYSIVEKKKQVGYKKILILLLIFPIKLFYKKIRSFFSKYQILREYIIYNTPKYKKYHVFNNLTQNSCVIDLGGCVGDVSEYISDKYNSYIHCYEPNQRCFDILKKKFKKKKKIKIYNSAVSNFSGKAKLYLSKLNYKNSNLIIFSQSSTLDSTKNNINKKNFLNVKVENISNILKKFNYIDLIKIDIEGTEYKILDALIKNKYKIKRVVCELHEKSYLQMKSKIKIIKMLNKKKLYNNWFIDWD